MAATVAINSDGLNDNSNEEIYSIISGLVIEAKERTEAQRSYCRQQLEQLKEAKERFERDYHRQCHQHEKDKESWRQRSAGYDDELKRLKKENDMLRAQKKELQVKAKERVQQLRKMLHLLCDICGENGKQKVTRCGHGFCESCLSTWFAESGENVGQMQENSTFGRQATCPDCRKSLVWANDVWPLHGREGET